MPYCYIIINIIVKYACFEASPGYLMSILNLGERRGRFASSQYASLSTNHCAQVYIKGSWGSRNDSVMKALAALAEDLSSGLITHIR